MAEAGVCGRTAWSSSGLLSLQTQAQALENPKRLHAGASTKTSLRILSATQAAGLEPGGRIGIGGGGGKIGVGGGDASGTRIVAPKRVKVLDESAKVRDKVKGEPVAIKLLSRVQQLRLLSKAEKAGLLSAAERAGLSLSSIEKLGLLSKAEKFGVLSAATDRSTPRSLLTIALVLLVSGPAFVYFVPEDAVWQIVLQFAVAFATILGGSAAFAASSFVSSLQKSSD